MVKLINQILANDDSIIIKTGTNSNVSLFKDIVLDGVNFNEEFIPKPGSLVTCPMAMLC